MRREFNPGELLSAGYRSSENNFDEIARSYGVEDCGDLGCMFLNHWPASRWQYHNRDLTVCKILLIFQILVCGEKNIEQFSIGRTKQIAVPGTTPTLLVNCRDRM